MMYWYDIFNEERKKDYYITLKNILECEYKNSEIYPKKEDIFNAFKLTPFEKIKVVILGQDPYHQPGQAQGLAFSVPKDFKKPPSLQNIFKEIESEFGKKSICIDSDLRLWSEQGVFLLNTILTVEKGKPLSHKDIGWTNFTDRVIKEISDKRDNIVFILWGNQAKRKKDIINSNKHLILEGPHPSPLSANRGFFGCNHFLMCNEYLRQNNCIEIEW